ncbi:MAG: hypothetical protein A4E45_02034 [Methanosaeta sp. PtaB.Bin039]|nr:MAG: hypothetical protein A4E45_02034 [Methanosaeta sp. PtaB.Bin039]OPY44077.1 MAG: hypothetical protein A4E47_01787 [Methanosaeta sp. PtaU1.Bin028]HOT06554.1 hypothetical protein [Methanotrichaceae archaeon]HQF16564.1 hypothetical protein [Methanotrichaceae archaeon]HQI91065.1 hypothetical protein [Methanotrichaceae archaeon]
MNQDRDSARVEAGEANAVSSTNPAAPEDNHSHVSPDLIWIDGQRLDLEIGPAGFGLTRVTTLEEYSRLKRCLPHLIGRCFLFINIVEGSCRLVLTVVTGTEKEVTASHSLHLGRLGISEVELYSAALPGETFAPISGNFPLSSDLANRIRSKMKGWEKLRSSPSAGAGPNECQALTFFSVGECSPP